MVGVYKDPEGKDIFSKSTMSPTDALGMSTTKIPAQNETHALRKRISDLEKKLEETVWIVIATDIESALTWYLHNRKSWIHCPLLMPGQG